jgi:predicted NUDIX family phosphoesterase
MKHAGHILAFEKSRFGLGQLGPLVNMSPKSFFEAAYASLFIARRHELETDERFGQFLPYVVLRRIDADGLVSFFEYQRTSKAGEDRLGGKKSVGVGGHVDLIDVRINDSSVIDVVATTAHAIARELNEEILFTLDPQDPVESVILTYDEVRMGKEGMTFKPNSLVPKFHGIINDMTDAVGRVHFGCVFTVDVPAEFEPKCREPELFTIGMRPVDEIAKDDLESWSRLILDDIAFLGVAAT